MLISWAKTLQSAVVHACAVFVLGRAFSSCARIERKGKTMKGGRKCFRFA